AEKQRKSPRRVRTIEEIEAEAPTRRIEDLPEARAKAGTTPPRPRTAMPVAPDETGARAHPQTGLEGARAGRRGPAWPVLAGSAFLAVPSVVQP
ncbi:hypothetical protein, partial [Nocardia farcinica]|uniref:hypothetical protein n=1 Tax=Nocardia farcinica TaxID=37329 RepID=UPI0018960220